MAKLFMGMTGNEIRVNSKIGATSISCKQIALSMFTCHKLDSNLASKALDPVLNGPDLYFSATIHNAMAGSSMQSFCCQWCK